MFSSDSVFSVSQITKGIKKILESRYRFVAIQGEISNLRTPFSGHNYFTLKDNESQIRSVLFKGNARYLKQPLKDGQQVICRGKISVYEPRGEYQIIVDTVELYGEGILRMQFEALKTKLAELGYFDASIKKTIPDYPQNITVISSATGAAIHDFLKICSKRQTTATIKIFPVAVQGERAAGEIAAAIARVNREIHTDIIVLCRGGGSLEDLWAFNEEIVARAIYDSSIPVVTGIGHEVDHTIADFCADLRSATPTAAAELIIPDAVVLKQDIIRQYRSLRRLMVAKLDLNDQKLRQQKRVLKSFLGRIENASLRLDAVSDRFRDSFDLYLEQHRYRIEKLLSLLERQAPLAKIQMQEQRLQYIRSMLERQIRDILKQQEDRLSATAALLQSVSPLSTLARGYSIVRRVPKRGEKVLVTDNRQVSAGDTVEIRLHKGQLECLVDKSLD